MAAPNPFAAFGAKPAGAPAAAFGAPAATAPFGAAAGGFKNPFAAAGACSHSAGIARRWPSVATRWPQGARLDPGAVGGAQSELPGDSATL